MIDLVEWKRKGKTFIGTPQQLVDELIYVSYQVHRRHHPEYTPQEWSVAFPSWERLEQRYQAEANGRSA